MEVKTELGLVVGYVGKTPTPSNDSKVEVAETKEKETESKPKHAGGRPRKN